MEKTAVMADVDFFNSKAAGWDADNTLSTDEKISTVLALAGVREGDSVLDVGCGTGVLLPAMLRTVGCSGRVTGIDFAREMLGLARAKHPDADNLELRLADVEAEPVEGRFDRIMLYCVFPHLHRAGATLRRLYTDNLNDGGTLTIAHPVGRDFINSIHHHCPIRSHGLPPASEVAAMMRTAGMRADRITDTADLYLVRATKPGEYLRR